MDASPSDDNLRGQQRGGGGGGKSQKADKTTAEPFTPTRTLRDRAAINPTPKAKAMQDSSDDEAPAVATRTKKKSNVTPPRKKIGAKPKHAKPKLNADDNQESPELKKRIAPHPTGKSAKPKSKADNNQESLPEPKAEVFSNKISAVAAEATLVSAPKQMRKEKISAPKMASAPKISAPKKTAAKTKSKAPSKPKSPAPARKKSKLKPAMPVSESEDSDDSSAESEDESDDENSRTSSASEDLTKEQPSGSSGVEDYEESSSTSSEEREGSEEECDQNDALGDTSTNFVPKFPTQDAPEAAKDKGGRPSAEKKAELEAAISEIAGIIAKVAQHLDLSYDRVLDTFLDHEGRGANPWNIYQQYVVANYDAEILRLPECDRVELRGLTTELVGRMFTLFKKHCKEAEEDPGEFLRKWRRKTEIEEGNCSFRARTESFQSWFARVQRIMKEGAEHWSFDSMFMACGRIVNQDQSLCNLTYAGLAEDFFSKQFGVGEPLIQGHFRTHVFNEASQTSAVNIKKRILATKCDSAAKSGNAEDLAEDVDNEPSDEEDLITQPTSKQQQEELELRRSLDTLLKMLKLTAGQKWKALPKSLVQKRYTLINWPRSVPLPFETAKRKGILGLSSDARKAWFAGLASKDHPLSLVPWHNNASAADTPIIKLVPEGPKKSTVCVFEDWTTRVNSLEVVRNHDNQWTPGTSNAPHSKPVDKASKKRAPSDNIPNNEGGLSRDEPGRPNKRSKTTDSEAQSESAPKKPFASIPPVPATPVVTPPSPQEVTAAHNNDETKVAPKKKANKDQASGGVAPSKKKLKKKDCDEDGKRVKTTKQSPETRPPSAEPQPTRKKSKKEKESTRQNDVPPRSNCASDDVDEVDGGRENNIRVEQKSHMMYTRNTQDHRGLNENMQVDGGLPPFTQRHEASQPQMPFYDTAHQNDGHGVNMNFFPQVQAFPESRSRSSTAATSESGFSMASMASEGSLGSLRHQRHSSLAPSEAEYGTRHYGHQETRSRNISPGLGYGFNGMNIPSNSNLYNDSWSGHGLPSQHANPPFGGRSPRWNNQQSLPGLSSSNLAGYDSQTQHASRLHQYARVDARQLDNFHGGPHNGNVGPGMNGAANAVGNVGPGMNGAANSCNLNVMPPTRHDGGTTGGSGNTTTQFPDNTFNATLLGLADQQGFRTPSEQPHMPYRVQDNVFN